ncbi:MAG: hypothetical protein EBY22_13745 [Gammaproteobacteria bacterium]|nr:hypothetical protein [Gammaproteobacteria bacterium]
MIARALSLQGFLSLLFVALLMATNHVAARLAFNSGLDIATAVAVRSGTTAIVVGSFASSRRDRRWSIVCDPQTPCYSGFRVDG